MKKQKLNNSLNLLRNHLKNISEEEKKNIQEFFIDKKPKGWLSIDEYLPMMYVKDITQGYSVFKVKDKNGKEFDSIVTDHNIWYYRAKDEGITHWFNE